MVTHAKLQSYRHNYGLVFMTGLLGCRWHRYKQSTQEPRKRDVTWFGVLLLTGLFISFFFYFILVAWNEQEDINIFIFTELDKWIPWYTILLAVISTLFTYITILLILSVCHILHGHQLYIYPIHLIFIVLTLALCVVFTYFVTDVWRTEWTVIYISLQITGPFLHIGAVCFMTVISWVVALQWYKLDKPVLKIVWLCVYVVLMLGLYISPVFINSPCVVESEDIPAKPNMFGHKGASGIAPENTVIAFQRAVDYGAFGLETDVSFSLDGVPFIMHDTTLKRTTNVADVFPELKDHGTSWFNMTQLKMLDIGSWFLERDPVGTVGSLSDDEKGQYRGQTIPTFSDLLQFAIDNDVRLMFDINPPPESHPFSNSTQDLLLQAIQKSGISPSLIWWLNDTRPSYLSLYRVTSPVVRSVEYLQSQNITGINVAMSDINSNQVSNLKKGNITTNLYIVNSRLFFSLCWCMGVHSITTDNCHSFSQLAAPIWHMAPSNYLLLWIIVDIASAVLIVVIFIIHRVRLQGSKFRPETISDGRTWANYRTRRSMKEKLLMKDVGGDIFDQEQEGQTDYGIESNYEVTVTVTEGRRMAQTFHSNGYQAEVELA